MMTCTREVPEVETDCNSFMSLHGEISQYLYDKVHYILTNTLAAFDYVDPLEHSTQEEVRQCILEACV